MAQTSWTGPAEKRDDLTVYGYIRLIDSFIPASIIILCFEFYHIPKDEWDKKLAKGLYNINKNTITHILDEEWCTAFLSNVVSENKHEWKLKIKKSYAVPASFIIGIYDVNSNVKDVIKTFIGNKPKSAYAWNNYTNEYNVDNKWIDINSYAIQVYQNEIICIIVDFTDLSLSYLINGKNCGKKFKIKKSKYRAAISTLFNGDQIELLQYLRC